LIGTDVFAAIEPVVATLETLGVGYRIGGSVASSALGVPRSTLDVDLVCDMRPSHVAPFVAALSEAYYVDEDMIRDAIRREASFNLVHLATMLKVDVFILKSQPWDTEAFSRKVRGRLDAAAGAREFDLTTAEDIILHKLCWYQLGDEVSERQWKDVLGVMAVQSDALDQPYLRRWAAEVGVLDLLERAMAEAGLRAGAP
jgi:hypothetical protein